MGVQLAMRDVRFIFFSDKVGLLIEMVCFMMLLFLQSRKKADPCLISVAKVRTESVKI